MGRPRKTDAEWTLEADAWLRECVRQRGFERFYDDSTDVWTGHTVSQVQQKFKNSRRNSDDWRVKLERIGWSVSRSGDVYLPIFVDLEESQREEAADGREPDNELPLAWASL